MSLAMVGLATGLGARYPRFNADNPSQVAGSYGGVAFMIVAVLYTIVLIALVGWPSSTRALVPDDADARYRRASSRPWPAASRRRSR